MELPGFVGPSYTAQALTADVERTVNLYIEKLQSPAASQRRVLYPTPGVSLLNTAGPGYITGGRAHFWEPVFQREFAVIGNILWEIDRFGNLTNRGTLAVDLNPATISSNGAGGSQLFITSGHNGYCYNLNTNVLTQVANLIGKATMGEYMDGYFFALDASTSTLWCSALLDGTTWSTTNFQQRSLAADPWISMKRLGRYMWLMGTVTSEVWFDAGTSPFPLAPHPAGLIQQGIGSSFSVAKSESVMYFHGATDLGANSVIRTPGFAPETVSTYPIENAISGYSKTSDAIGWVYDDRGHTFYILTFPTASATWCYDGDSGEWTERGTWIAEQGAYTYWRPCWHALAFGQHRVLDFQTGAIYQLGQQFLADVDGRPIRRLRRAPGVTQENQRIYYASVEVDLESGLGASTGQDVLPEIAMRYSNDGGRTWTPEMIRTAGAMGQYSARARWNRCGMGRRRVFEWSMSDPHPWMLTNAYIELGQGIRGVQPQAQRAR